MYVIVVGGEGIGEHLAKLLVRDGVNVVILERDKAVCDKLAKTTDALVVNGDGDDADILREAGVDRADVLVSVTRDDSLNLMSSMLAKDRGVKTIVSVVNDAKHISIFEKAGVTTAISPDIATARYLADVVKRPDISTLYFLGGGRSEMFEVVVPPESKIAGMKLKEIDFPEESLVVAIYRDEELLIPKAETLLKIGDKVTVFASLEVQKQVKAKLTGTE